MPMLNSRTNVFGAKRSQNHGSAAWWWRDYESASSTNRLSARESEILHWLACGKSGPEIAIILGISACTVRVHIQSVKRKLNAVNIPHAVYLAFVPNLPQGSPPLLCPELGNEFFKIASRQLVLRNDDIGVTGKQRDQ